MTREKYIQRDDPIPVESGRDRVVVTKVYTPRGERLEIATPDGDARIRLDAIELESLSWQDPNIMTEWAPDRSVEAHARPEVDEVARVALVIANEWARAEVGKLGPPGRERLRISAPNLGYAIHLTAAELAIVAAQDHDLFTEFLRTPYGPE